MLLLFILVCVTTSAVRAETSCPHPAVPARATVQLTSDERRPGTLATYSCDDGYELFGTATKVCSADGKWTKGEPVCGTNIALHKPASQLSKADNVDGEAKFAVDGDAKTCTRTKSSSHPWWSVDLLRPFLVRAIRLVPNPDLALENLEIRVGNSSRVESSVLCTWFPGVQEVGTTLMEECSRPVTGQFVFVQSRTTEIVLSLCEAEVFSSDEFAANACARSASDSMKDVVVLNGTCYEFQVDKDGDLETARSQCSASFVNGDLLQELSPKVFGVIKEQLEQRKLRMRSNKLVWLGAQREPGPLSRLWKWIGSGEIIRQPMWARDQPNNYIGGDQNCVALDGQRNWDWNDLGCNVNYLNWVCQGAAWSCGRPQVNLNATVQLPAGTSIGAVARYICPIDSKVDGDVFRTCGADSRWTGVAPTCTYVNCGPLATEIPNGSGRLVDERTTFNASFEYSCFINYTMVGNPTRVCGPSGKWSGEEPSCLFKWCERLSAPINGTVVLENDSLEAGTVATFVCDKGHVIDGPSVIKCELGGRWSGPNPVCRFVDCGVPGSPIDGTRFLVNGSTTLGSVVQYSCNENFRLVGPRGRVCNTDGSWSNTEPVCELITCPRPPVPPGGIVSGQSLNVGAVIEYACDPGNYLIGPERRICTAEGDWSDVTPECKYVNCGPLQPVLKGQLNYINESTHLDSQVIYTCSRNYRMLGEPTRVCQRNGEWSGEPPRCEEIRCGEPERTPHSTVHVRNNDRARSQAWTRAQLLAEEAPSSPSTSLLPATNSRVGNPSFVANSYRIGARATYQCDKGFRIDGQFVRQCEVTGGWTKSPPTCTYVDCGPPPVLENGFFSWPDESRNLTYLGITVVYDCRDGFRLAGRNSRQCDKDGFWGGEAPTCSEITCDEPERSPTVFKVAVEGYKVGSRALYSCAEGQQMTGDPNVYCMNTGFWSGSPPSCSWVECGDPGDLENGRVYKLNQTNVYNSVVEYHCFPNYSLKGRFSRRCTADGTWEGDTPKCELDSSRNEIPGSIAASPNLNSEQVRNSSSLGTYIAVGAVLIFLLLIIVAVLWLRMRRASTDSNKYVGNKPEGRRDGVELKPYGSVDGNHHNLNVDVDMDAMNGGIDFHQQSDGIYANIDHMEGNGYAMAANDGYSDPDPRPVSSSSSMTSYRGRNGHMARMRHQELSPVPSMQTGTNGNVTINGVAVH